MSAVVLWLYGALSLGSLFMAVSWWHVAVLFAADRPIVRSRRFIVAASLVLHAVVMTLITAFRAWDMAHHANVIGSEAGVLVGALIGLLLSKAGLVWAGSLPDGPGHVRWPWPLFIAGLMMWAGVVGGLA